MIPKYVTKIQSAKAVYCFIVLLHEHRVISKYHLDPREHYLRNGGAIPAPPHYELEIVVPQVTVLKQFNLAAARSVIDSKLVFINNAAPLCDVRTAMHLFTLWSVSSVLQMEGGPGLSTVLSGICNGDIQRYYDYMKKHWGIRVKTSPALKRD
jgi:hypothetical protein